MPDDINLIQDAMAGARGDWQQQLAREGVAMVAKVLRKGHDYGDSIKDPPYLLPGVFPKTMILARLSDKIARLRNLCLLGTEGIEVNESMADTMSDIPGYCLLWLCVHNNSSTSSEKPTSSGSS